MPGPEPVFYPERDEPSFIDRYPTNYSTKIANRGDARVPEAPLMPRPDLSGRTYDGEIDCWVREPAQEIVLHAKRIPRLAPMPATRGRFSWSILDAVTGARFGSFHANHTAEAVTIAGEWAVACGFEFGDVHVQHDR